MSAHTVGRTTLTLAVVAVIVGSDEGLVDLDGVGDRLAEAVSVHRHDEVDSHKVLKDGECRV